jgi:hypothetical protein
MDCYESLIILTHFLSFTDPDTRIIALPKTELDKANKDTKHYPPFFEVCAYRSNFPIHIHSTE